MRLQAHTIQAGKDMAFIHSSTQPMSAAQYIIDALLIVELMRQAKGTCVRLASSLEAKPSDNISWTTSRGS